MSEAEEAFERLATATAPLLVGVRHHSPALSAAVPALLDSFRPERVFVELPEELGTWLPWLGHAALVPPVALAAARPDGALWFYPFASFSPELAAIRWAVAHDVPVEAFDLPCREREVEEARTASPSGLLDRVAENEGAHGTEALWDRLVEAHAPMATPEELRRAGLAFGWAVRHDAANGAGVPMRDRRREAYMRHRLAAHPGRAAAVVGSFHAAALLERDLDYVPMPGDEVATSLVPYAFDLLDSRSGYPAGIRDPLWQERVWKAARDGVTPTDAAREVIVAVAREVRALGHVAGVPDAKEAVRMALDLAQLRGLAAPGRREVLEAIESALGRGEALGRGRVLAKALERVMVGNDRGRLAPSTPRSGLAPHVAELLGALGLPGPGTIAREPETFTLDPLRSALDRRRHVAIERLLACGIPYATREDPGAEGKLTARWKITWSPAIEARIELAGLRGVTLVQAAEGALRTADRAEPSARSRLVALEAAARAGLPSLTAERLRAIAGPFRAEAGLAEIVDAIALVERIARGQLPGLPTEWTGGGELAAFTMPPDVKREELLASAVAALEALAGSQRDEDALAMLELTRLRGELDDPGGRLAWTLDTLAAGGAPKMQGAAGALRVHLGRDSGEAFGVRVGSWIDAGTETAARLRGALLVAAPVLEGDPTFLGAIAERVAGLPDETFLARLPALRDGFDALSPAARTRLLAELTTALGEIDLELEDSAVNTLALVNADHVGREALALRGYPLPAAAPITAVETPPTTLPTRALHARDRWRLVLGRERPRLSTQALPLAIALDELYGTGRGEGSRSGLGGGHEAPFPTVREWGRELEALFGERVREEVLGRAGARGRIAAALAVDPDRVQPSVGLLETLLSLKGGLPESQLAQLRRLVARIVDALVAELATRVRPTLAGLTTPRSGRRRSGAIDLAKTIRRNMHTARIDDGELRLVPDHLQWRQRARRSLDWHVALVVDVSGSMEPSVIYAAMMAAILSGLPALSVQFYAFNTQVIDLTDRVDDPLGLLLEVSVGGGTYIAQAIAYARSRLRVPARSLVVVVSDFEEGESVPSLVAETRALVETGAKVLGLAALDDRGKPRYQRAVAEQLVDVGMPIAALTPVELARWVAEQIR